MLDIPGLLLTKHLPCLIETLIAVRSLDIWIEAQGETQFIVFISVANWVEFFYRCWGKSYHYMMNSNKLCILNSKLNFERYLCTSYTLQQLFFSNLFWAFVCFLSMTTRCRIFDTEYKSELFIGCRENYPTNNSSELWENGILIKTMLCILRLWIVLLGNKNKKLESVLFYDD